MDLIFFTLWGSFGKKQMFFVGNKKFLINKIKKRKKRHRLKKSLKFGKIKWCRNEEIWIPRIMKQGIQQTEQ